MFFPKGDQTAQLLQTAAVFAVGFFARPVGAWAFGLYADRRGRKAALTTSVALMCLGSLIVAVVPGYATIGAAAPVILTLARLLQGFSIGGEYGASATYLSEMAGRERRGLWSSFQFVTLIGGQLTALAVLILLQHTLSAAQLGAWGWRIPFVIGAAWRWWSSSSRPACRERVLRGGEEGGRRRLVSSSCACSSEHPAEVGIIFMLSGAGALGFYCFTTYMQKFLTNTGHFSKGDASTISAASLIAYLLMMPLFGWLGDRFGRRNLLIFAFRLRRRGGVADPGRHIADEQPVDRARPDLRLPRHPVGLFGGERGGESGAVSGADPGIGRLPALRRRQRHLRRHGGVYRAGAESRPGHEQLSSTSTSPWSWPPPRSTALRMRDTQALSLIEAD